MRAPNFGNLVPPFSMSVAAHPLSQGPTLLDDLGTGRELVIAEGDRATRSMWDGLQIIKAVIDAGASIKVLDRSYIDIDTPHGAGFMAMMSATAEDNACGSSSAPTKAGRSPGERRPYGAKAELTPH